ncbi:DnaD domain protein [Psychrobacillus sp. FSL H8-0483]|uniref:DnaD domain protein n=1 Tax=Psychrobacillus sp. FSL H8-0483 TaxID=2921389 RepID=UPI00315ACA90
MTIDELNAKHEVKFKEKTGMTVDEWLLNKYKTITPFELIKAYYFATKDEETLVKDLQDLGLNNGVINALLEYIFVLNGKGFVQSLVLDMGKNWVKNDILTVERAIKFMKEQDRKKLNESPER